ncbi:MAG: hypothetical protein IPO81_22275 [Kouleothrix sp.]|nr:hypothetical protein [Kouleothrix sp.]
MKRVDRYGIEALVLIGLGVLFLLQNLGLFGGVASLIWTIAFLAGGATFLVAFARNPASWWALIPGFCLLGIGLIMGLNEFFPVAGGVWSGAVFLAMLSLGFWAVYLAGRERWWAVIPAGVLLTLALITVLTETVASAELGWVFFLGMGLTFGLLPLLPGPEQHKLRWALIPAGVMLAMALLMLALSEPIFNMLWPLTLILAGLYVGYRALRPRHQL